MHSGSRFPSHVPTFFFPLSLILQGAFYLPLGGGPPTFPFLPLPDRWREGEAGREDTYTHTTTRQATTCACHHLCIHALWGPHGRGTPSLPFHTIS